MIKPIKLAKNNFLSSFDLSTVEIYHILELAKNFKNKKININFNKKVLGLIFDKSSTPTRVSPDIPIKAKMFVLEMNNDTNTIMGISIIKNYVYMNQHHKIYSWGNWNRYIYKGKYRVNNDCFTREEMEFVEKIESRIFKGKGHLKRGQGIQRVPYDRYDKSDLLELKQMFLDRKS